MLRVDLLGQLDEAERVAERGADLVGQVVRVDRDAVPADARVRGRTPGSRRAWWRRRAMTSHRSMSELVAEHRHLVDQRDVDVPVGVLQQLGHLGLAGAACTARPCRRSGRRTHGAAAVHSGGEAADDLRGVAARRSRVARVDPLRRERQVEVAAARQPGGLEDRPDDLLGRARVGGRLQHDQHPGAEVPRDGRDRGVDGVEVRARRRPTAASARR